MSLRRPATGSEIRTGRRGAPPRLGALFLVLILIAAAPGSARAGGNLEAVVNNGTGNKIANAAWNSLAIPIAWKINDQGVVNNCNNGNPTCVGGVSPITLQRAIDGITTAFNSWQAVPTSKIAFGFAGTTSQTNIGTDTVHMITWADTNPNNCPIGVIAVTPNFSLSAPLTLTSTNRDVNNDGIIDIDPAIYPNGTVLPAGTIIDADTAFCPGSFDFVDSPIDSPSPDDTLDFVAVATHELGHFHGLAHSTLSAPLATLFPFVDFTVQWGNDARSLSQDEIASTSRTYPESSFASGFGTITGQVLFPGSTTPATGVSVTAFNKATGEQMVQVFSVSQFTATSDPPGSFRIDGLPPGTYWIGVEYFDGGTVQGAPDAWWANNRFNLTVFNGTVSGVNVRPPIIARPEFLSSPENSTDDLAPSVPVTVGAGQTVGAGTIIINTDNPAPPTGATALNLPNGTYVQVPFPAGFSFPFFGQSYTSAFVGDNGNLTFGVAGNVSADTRNFLGPDQTTLGPVPPRIALPLTNLDPGADNTGGKGGPPIDVWSQFVSDAQGSRMELTYLGIPLISTHKTCTAIVRLFGSGRIEIQYRFWSSWWGLVGITPGGDGTEPAAAIDVSRQLPFSGSAGQTIYEPFDFAQAPSLGGDNHFRSAYDLNGALLIFTPNAAGGYDLTSPELAANPPGEAQNLVFTSATALAWDARAGATTYNVYRGALGSFVDSNGDGAADAYGACLDHGLVSPADADVATPATGSGFFYLVTARNAAGEGPLGFASSGAPMPNTQPCP